MSAEIVKLAVMRTVLVEVGSLKGWTSEFPARYDKKQGDMCVDSYRPISFSFEKMTDFNSLFPNIVTEKTNDGEK